MKICHMSTVHPLYDNRIFHKQCKSLAGVGYEVSLVVTHDRNEMIDGIQIVGLKSRTGRLSRMVLGVFEALLCALRQKARVYHFHDPELIPAGIVLKLLGKKVIYDVHESTSRIIMSKKYLGGILLRKLIAGLIFSMEQLSKLLFDAIIVVSPDSAQHWNSPKVHIIVNAAVLENIDKASQIKIKKTKPIVIYAGMLIFERGLKQVIEAIGMIGDKAELWLLGSWRDEDFKHYCETLEGWKHVKYFGFLPVHEVYAYMKLSDIAVVTFLPAPNHVTAFPNKPLEYMSSRLPVIMSDFEFWKQAYGDNVLFVNPESSVEIKNAIERLLNDADLRSSLGNRGRKFVEDNFSWESESKKLFAIYKSLEPDSNRKGSKAWA